ncbi:type VI secretion system-associated protein TagF [Larsenimonas rhizosphaerae]|uniref:Type VI secretion system-associated protein TagF n=1 Tax=Larsenimonas rhizosphaerae TaxID=2944682 RepID=A0AA41ZDW7_9GAMM|nr:type VI secretion system-associated protein TagF [Larsenimonas rhizosphaerae]MCM2130790.1 type VI secretion system-associated protein TagF [Larsenimonas rhizosphaerae]MCX2523494.1 type VI secretion system-associated protein TagF [Larsenimonas rhizosphaerae]
MIGCFGKIPCRADFVGVNASGEVIRELDQWFQQALLRFLDHSDWQQRFDALPICYFSYHARAGGNVIGAMISSSDASQRRYPFFIYQMLNGERIRTLTCQHTLAEISASQIRQILTDAVHGDALIDPIRALSELRNWTDQDLVLYQRVNERFLENYSLSDITAAMMWNRPEFVLSACLHRLYYVMQRWQAGSTVAALLPLPAERGLKRPVADLWQQWLGRACPGGLPVMSLLIDDFMQPCLLIMPSWSSAEQFYEVLSEPGNPRRCIDVMASFHPDEAHPGTLSLPDMHSSLAQAMARFPSHA